MRGREVAVAVFRASADGAEAEPFPAESPRTTARLSACRTTSITRSRISAVIFGKVRAASGWHAVEANRP